MAAALSVLIIDPVSPEFNRGSFCYLPYLLYAAEKADGIEVAIRENFCAADVDELPKAEEYWIALWSHPQIEHVQTLLRFLPRGRVRVFGYAPLIAQLRLPPLLVSSMRILRGLANYPFYYSHFNQILLSDCDMHLSEYTGQVYPLFTSYGCPNGCSFCPSTANQPTRLSLTMPQVQHVIEHMAFAGHTSIHFTDEDLFYDTDRAHSIVRMLLATGVKWQLIALASSHTLQRYVDRYGSAPLQDAGFKLLEVGLESASDALSAVMGKTGRAACERLSESVSVPILWLTLTFYPGETIQSLRATGEFLEKHGLDPCLLYPRIATNGTVGGLGQFFQPYEGTKGWSGLQGKGRILTPRPLRLLPSFIPHSFAECSIKDVRAVRQEERQWYELYHVDPYLPEVGVHDTIQDATLLWDNPVDGFISLAVSSRLGVIQ